MSSSRVSRRNFFGVSAAGTMAASAALTNPMHAAAQAVGIKPSDLPDLTIKEVKVHVMDRWKLGSIVTNSGIEGNYPVPDRYSHPNWSNMGWLEYAKGVLVGKNVRLLPTYTVQWVPVVRRYGQSSYAGSIDHCLWDILGKAVGLPIYVILGAYREKVLAYASSQHLNTVDDFVADVQRCKAEGYKAYKIHPPWVNTLSRVDFKLDVEVAKAVRQTAGDDFILLHDRVGAYTREQAMRMGRLLDELHYVAYEDPIPTTDIDGLVELCHALDVPVHIGEFIFSPYDFAEYIRRGALDVVRFIQNYVGGITGGMKIAHLAECFGLECVPHNWGDALEHAAHFHCELAMPNNVWFEMTQPTGASDRPYMLDRLRIDKDGYVPAPTKPGLGYDVDRAALEKLTVRIDR